MPQSPARAVNKPLLHGISRVWEGIAPFSLSIVDTCGSRGHLRQTSPQCSLVCDSLTFICGLPRHVTGTSRAFCQPRPGVSPPYGQGALLGFTG